MVKNKLKVLVKGAYGHANFGDDALMWTIERFFNDQFPELDVWFSAGNEGDYCAKLLSRAGFINYSKLKEMEVDVMVYGGGTQFFLFNGNRSGIRYHAQNFTRLLRSNPGVLVKKIHRKLFGTQLEGIKAAHVAGLGLGLGPFNDDNTRVKDIKHLVNSLEYLYVRDEVSLEYCHQWCMHKAGLGADICFSSYGTAGVLPLNGFHPKGPGDKRKIGVIVRDWDHEQEGRAYYEPLLRAMEEMNGNDEFVFIIFSPVKDKMWRRLLSERNKPYISWDPATQSIPAFMAQLNTFDGFITARYHGAVFAALLNKPAICIEIEPKLEILTEQVPEMRLWRKPFRKEELKEQMDIFYNREFDCAASVQRLRDRANNMLTAFARYMHKIEK
ncbi:polysaccharide pyruvyl transferase family protein [Chitinophaga agrisoli]|uniref:Polysaccharide pyruvyl transferase family protein n=1 Tax=Chitinophaga agrisoli TaxID=2607653 RepID=A0A5B2VK22_9BACT|nr:polysaccharide pyruvyl transferase family protein [Chitinophaga agrisoli]KAA2239194.1 polysaccharide pyruvyl transferase family protein [Chitinophaga agrisoli]